ncbi:MAG: HNH endonuclease signature motif containing protein [Desulfovibrionaceae bacterium]|nr:HNH endonuclease signature motif containing protein [Desulfovibrionaceae bacterium]
MLDIAYCIQTAIWTSSTIDNGVTSSIRDVRHMAIRRDDYTCQGCGCYSSVSKHDLWCGLEVHHADDNPNNDSPDNLVTVCPLCHGILHLDLMLREGNMPGRFLWTEAVSQIHLNMITHVRAVAELLTAELEAGPPPMDHALERAQSLRDKCRKLYAALNELALPAGLPDLQERKDGGLLMSKSPAIFGSVLGEFVRSNPTARERDAVARHLRPLRWLYDWEADVKAKCYADASVWNEEGDWQKNWTFLEQTVLNTLKAQGGMP